MSIETNLWLEEGVHTKPDFYSRQESKLLFSKEIFSKKASKRG